ncbi:MAG: AAA family ATPase [Pseudomonadota bacterium]
MNYFFDYSLQEILFSENGYGVWRARHFKDGIDRRLKILTQTPPQVWVLDQLKYEHNLLLSFPENHPNRPLALINDRDTWGIVFPFRKEIPFSRYLVQGARLDLEIFFQVAVTMADLLGEIHANHIIHRDIRPETIMIDPDTLDLRLDNFRFATELDTRNQAVTSPNQMIGTLAYMSPEQTGRMNSAMDYRTDFYALGVTFYEWLTGQLPFYAEDDVGMVHCHLAKQPEDPRTLNPDIGPMLGRIIMKLLSKNPEKRYQSSHGLRHDLELCSHAHAGGVEIDVEPGQKDVSNRFVISSGFYGRKSQLADLLDWFEQARVGAGELVLVSGYSGVGKTALVDQLAKSIQESGAIFIRGKFDHLQQDIAYSAINQAFEGLARQILSTGEDEFVRWKEHIWAAINPFGQLILDIVPGMVLLLGNQPEPEPVDAAQAQTRLGMVFTRLVKVFARPEHPLVLFLDDLQWADPASLKLLEYIATAPGLTAMLTLGAFRDNEVDAAHPLSAAVDRISHFIPVRRLELGPLPDATLARIVADTLHASPDAIADIASMVHAKTVGNPFFASELLKMLFWDGSIFFNESQGVWEWDSKAIHGSNISNDVVAFMLERIRSLPGTTRKKLHLASCIGNTFDLESLGRLSGELKTDIARTLLPALEQGYLVPLTEGFRIQVQADPSGSSEDYPNVRYRFHHDRIQEAAYGMENEEDRQQTHLSIARILDSHRREKGEPGLLDEVIRHYRKALSCLADMGEVLRVALLHTEAAEKAMKTNSFDRAMEFSVTAISLFPETIWQEQYDAAWKAYYTAAESAFLCVKIEQAEMALNALLGHSRTLGEYLGAVLMAMRRYATLTEFDRAIDMGIQGLGRAGIRYKKNPGFITVAVLLTRYWFLLRLGGSKMGTLEQKNAGNMDRHDEVICEIFNNLSYCAFCVRKLLLIPYSAARVAFTLVGNRLLTRDLFSYMCAWCACGAHIFFKDYRAAGKWLAFSGKVLGRDPSLCDSPYELFIYGYYLVPFQEPWSKARACFERAVEMMAHNGVDIGGINSLGVMYEGDLNVTPTQVMVPGMEDNLHFIRRFGSTDTLMAVQAILVFVRLVADQTPETSDPSQSWDEIAARSLETGSYAAGYVFLHRAMYLYLMDEQVPALSSLAKAKQYLLLLGSTFFEIEIVLYGFLIAAALYPEARGPAAIRLRIMMAVHYRKMKKWAAHNPGNFLHMKRFMDAEYDRINHKPGRAVSGYRDAARIAEDNGFLLHGSHIHEQAAKTLLVLKRVEEARLHMQQAHDGYRGLGWSLKTRFIQEHYSELMVRGKSDPADPDSRYPGS